MRKIIFLDIDGVLNHQLYYKERKRKGLLDKPDVNYPYSEVDPEKVELLNMLIENNLNHLFIRFFNGNQIF